MRLVLLYQVKFRESMVEHLGGGVLEEIDLENIWLPKVVLGENYST